MGDDSESSDDELLSAPAFRRSSRKETAKETKAMKMLDTILDQSEMKMNRQERMNEMIQEGNKGFVPSKEDLELGMGSGSGSGNVSPVDNIVGKTDDSNSRPAKMAKIENDTGVGDAMKNSTEKGNGNRNAIDRTDEGGDDEDEGERSFPLRPISPSEIKTAPPQSQVLPQKFNIKDPSYWSKIDSIVAESAEKKVTVAQRRKFILDRIDDCAYDSSEEYGDGNGRNSSSIENDLRGAHKEQKIAEINGMHSTLGMRRTLGWYRDDKKISRSMTALSYCFTRFVSAEDAIAALEIVLKKYDAPLSRVLESDEEAAKNWVSFRNCLVKPLKQVITINIQLLPHILERKWPDQLKIIPEDFMMWLIRLAISGVQSRDMHCNEAATMVQNVLQLCIPVIRYEKEKVEDVNHLFQLKELPVMLESLFGLWIEGCEDGSDVQPTNDKNDSSVNIGCFDNPYGLYNALAIWATAIEKGTIDFANDAEETKNDIADCLAMVLLCGIDPIFYSGRSLLDPKANLIQSLLTLAHRQFLNKCNDDQNPFSQDFFTWMSQTSNLALDTCCHRKLESLKFEGSERPNNDYRKVHEFLTSDLVVRSWQDVDQTNQVFATFYYILSKCVLDKCLEDEVDLDGKSQNLALDLKKNIYESCTIESIPLRLRAIATVECTFNALVSSNVTKEATMFLATVGIANHCEQIGIALFMINTQKKGIYSAGICESESEAAVLYGHFDRLLGRCTDLKKTVKGVCNNLNMQRAVKLLSQLMSYYREMKDLTGKWGRCVEVKKRQSNVSDYFGKIIKKSESDDDDSTL